MRNPDIRTFPMTTWEMVDEGVEATPDGARLDLLVVSGSWSYGLEHEHSDIDLRGIYTLPNDHLLRVTPPVTTIDHNGEDVDVALKEMGTYIKLAADGNPHTLETIWGPDDCVVWKSDIGRMLREERHALLSMRAVRGYLGYLGGQIKYSNRMDPDHRRFEKTKRHIVRLIFCCRHILEEGVPLVRLNNAQIKEIKEIPTILTQDAFIQWAEAEHDKLTKVAAFSAISLPEQVDPATFDGMCLALRHAR